MKYKGHPVIDNPESTEQAAGWDARFPGVCVACRGPIDVGQRITKGTAGFGYMHMKCPPAAVPARSNSSVVPNTPSSTQGQVGGQADPGTVPLGLPNGVWTVEGPRGHRTYRIVTILPSDAPKREGGFLAEQDGIALFRDRHAGKRVLQLLTGPDNTASYRGLAWIVEPAPIDMYAKFKAKVPFHKAVTQKNSCIGKLWAYGKQPNVEVLINVFAKLVERGEELPGYTVHFARHCYKCNRLLTTPESIKRGIGPVCAQGGWDS